MNKNNVGETESNQVELYRIESIAYKVNRKKPQFRIIQGRMNEKQRKKIKKSIYKQTMHNAKEQHVR